MAPALDLPPDVRWSCLQCGRSCEDWSEVGVDAEGAERVGRLPLAGAADAVDADAPDGPVLRFQPAPGGGSRCPLLAADGRCAVHAAYGVEAKPKPCRAFPFLFVDTPDGTLAAVSFACTAVLHDHGEPLAVQAGEVERVHAFASHRERCGPGLRLAPGEPLAWPAYREVETELAELLERAPDARTGLIEQARWLRRTAALAPLDERPSAALRDFALGLLVDTSGVPPRFREPVAMLVAPDPERLLRRWLRHRIWRKDLVRGGEVWFAHALLLAETGLALAWARDRPGGLAEAVAQVERGLSLHSDLVDRLQRDPARRALASRLFAAPRYAASLLSDGDR